MWLAIMCAKVSILVFYIRLSSHKYFRIITYGTMAIIIIYGVIGSLQFLFACRPIAKFWDPTITYGSCSDNNKFWISNAAVNSVTDIIMVILPILMLWNVRIPKRQKIGLILIFMTGIL
ncbi:hypothetical protein MPH_12998 [Macrophomina phaseolina MS6]|uniref:Rhodopsin domain-containing protein n=1 Tax=Macrophomina phaseolina (strain MS6) TaxID=1126212 RepID=K2QJ78_MACPH|nr:hypothetical protein MPH_12998 [Macrophomina phaseolina MS6]